MTGLSIQAAIWGSSIGAFVLFAALAYLRSLPDAPAGPGYWTAGFGFYCARLVCYLAADALDPVFVTFIAESLQSASSLLLMAGTLSFRGRNLPSMLVALGVGTVVLWAAFTTFILDDFLLRSIPLYGVSGAALLFAGASMLIAHRKEKIPAAGFVGVALVLWGLHKFDYPWLRSVEWFAPYGFLLAELFGMMAAVGLLLLTAGRLRVIATEAEKKLEQSREHLSTLNQLLQISLGRKNLKEQLSDSLDVVFAAPWLSVKPRGAILLVENGHQKFKAHRELETEGFSTSVQVPLGNCACGRVAGDGEIVHTTQPNETHQGRNDDALSDDHYSVPIVNGGEMLGVLLLYLLDRHAGDEVEAEHLRSIADVLAGMVVRKRAEAGLDESRERLIEAQRIAQIGSWENNLQTSASIWSAEQFRILGYLPGEVEPSFESFFATVHPDDRDAVSDAMAAIQEADNFSVEHRVVHPDGTVLYVSEVAEIERDAAGNAVRMAGTTQDITEDKVAALALMRAKQAAEAANQAKSSFLATMSHELRTPLNAVIGFAQLLQQQPHGSVANRKCTEYVQHIRESGEHLLSVINDILDISRIEAGQSDLEEVAVDMADLVCRTTNLMEAKSRDSGLVLERRLPENLPQLLGDARALKQILLNLVANALKFTDPGGRVTVELSLVDGALELAVSDTGIGVAPTDHKRIFEPFVQAESALNRRFDGTGLGLPLVKSLVEQHNGRVLLDSALSVGTRVSVIFPPARLLPAAAPLAAKARLGA